MARWGEGDPRWIVEERPDATNVNNWHWVEKDATQWSIQRLKDLLVNQTFENENVKIDFTQLSKIEGEASANNRKGKLIFFYEWAISIDFTAAVSDSAMIYTGTIQIENLSDEFEANEIRISSFIKDAGPETSFLFSLLNNEILELIRSQIGKYISDLKKEYSQGLILPTESTRSKTSFETPSKSKTVVKNSDTLNKNISEEGKVDKIVSFVDFELTESFKVAPQRLYEILTDQSLVPVWCPDSVIDARDGGSFSMLSGAISGTFTSLIKDKQISMNWRLKSFPKDVWANINLILHDKGDSVDLQVKAEKVPEERVEETREGFRRYYFKHIGYHFGISLQIM
ncbi:Aha1_N domain-containing protein [Meloidogyne graminicola]|uniref:Aha1_N domain-containing protein n=2 Tax=Meloidogyne TaxID=189290 RepID=A0A8S9ZYL1_9BILA|nr:Aha1_N domain-containing protein [Meloidogyne graminicola]